MAMPFTAEEMKAIYNAPLADVAKNMGFQLVSADRQTYKVKDQGGLYIYKPEHGRGWYQFSTGDKGNIVDFVMKYGNMGKLAAMEYILGSKAYAHTAVLAAASTPLPAKKFELPPKADSYKQMIAYLAGTRKIDKDIVYHCIKNRLIYQAKKELPDGNCVFNCAFVGYDKEGEAQYCHLRSVNSFSSFRGDVEGSDKSFGFALTGADNTLFVFESAIDALSGATMIKDLYGERWKGSHYLSLNGASNIQTLTKYLDDHDNINKVHICLDNDEAGKLGCERISAYLSDKGMSFTKYTCFRKDMNDDLKDGINIFSFNPRLRGCFIDLLPVENGFSDIGNDIDNIEYNHIEE